MVRLQRCIVFAVLATGAWLPSVTPWSSSSTHPPQHSFSNNGVARRLQPISSPQLLLPYRSIGSTSVRASFFELAVHARAADMDDRQSLATSMEDESVEAAADVDLGNVNHQLTLASADGVGGDMTGDVDMKELTTKVLNGVFLAVCFGWAAYTIFSIDAGMTRGWTQSEIAMRIPLDNWSNYESSLMEKPIFTKTLINVVIYLLGDWLSQTVFQQKDVLDFDVSRTLKNGFIGLCFGPLVHTYYQWSDHILPPDEGLAVRVQKILMDQTLYLSVKCSIYISAVGLLSGDDFDTVKQTVKDKIGGIVVTAWKFWPLVHCITYGVIPARHRILWVNSVDLIWNAILATKARKSEPQDSGDNLGDDDDDSMLTVPLVHKSIEITDEGGVELVDATGSRVATLSASANATHDD